MSRFVLCALIATSAFAATPVLDSTHWDAVRGNAVLDAAVQHDNHKALRVEPGASPDAAIRSAPVALTIGKHYELSGWVRTDGIEVRDLDRSPIATGATITMASMPFDVHAASVGATHDWTRLTLHFTATRAQDSILLTVGNGGAFKGKAWFEGVSVDEASKIKTWPAAEAVESYGPAYRYPQGGWIYLHIEGKPYDRGYQHGRLMTHEIPQYLERCAADLGYKSQDGWQQARTTANALFLRGFDDEILQEMKGIADGASDAGARFYGHRIDLIDIVTANVEVEMGMLREAMPMTPNGLEGLHLTAPDFKHDASRRDRCSAFAATGRATRDGKMVIGHVTWWPLTLAEQTNVMLDIQPVKGHRMLIQSYPGGIESGTDWYQNDAGVVLTETTIRQTPFNAQGTPVAYRARKAIQYGDNVDKVVEYLNTRNNGLYTNEWLIGDAKNNEIAMFELGTYKTKLWRSTKNQWFGGTEGFYWGCNNTKDLDVRLEDKPDPQGKPEYLGFVPAPRDLKWQEMYQKYQGTIDEQFAFLAFRTAPLVSASTMDAKVATADMASRMMVWAAIGKPNQREWVPGERQKEEYEKNAGLYPSGYRLFTTEAPSRAEVEHVPASLQPSSSIRHFSRSVLWQGWVLPTSDADTWFAAGSAAYYDDLHSRDLDKAMLTRWAAYRRLQLDEPTALTQYEIEKQKGALFLDSLRQRLGDDKFLALMRSYFAANTTKRVTAQSFLNAAGVSFEMPAGQGHAVYIARDVFERLHSTLIVYGTGSDAGANRYAAEQIQSRFLNMYESIVPIRKDFELTDDDLRTHDVVFVGRPEGNSALAAIARNIGLNYTDAVFRIQGQAYASETESLIYAAPNPVEPKHMVLVVAGNDPLGTVQLATAEWPRAEYAVFNRGNEPQSGYLR
ncbi:MAG TPA: C45 family autoproteolytic acyltransferase/hydrolase [Bryobacteraceae bacterium]|nr:C45 family autoproteolytic acyltransferase/hydrolase [Bryobacteraceae bacterium]